ncbi:hypothetical protein NDN08_001936 [Rhodosorus marinus]|uniref:IBR domain-containing protein n=1 Tax=Rhodosorus marinus TaxID=101924 RepID=A0AAV8USC8_9RHOD|nr:hypothetical protein NDN08_001936 [Rhodosorus marinus]
MKRLLRDAMLRRLEYFQATLCSDRRGPHSAIYCTADGCFRKFTLPADTEALASEPLNCECGSTFVCPICAQSGHPGRGCIYGDDYSPVGERRKLFRRRGKYRICPGCGATTRAVVMKEDGCNSIHCIFCREAWCWTCSKSLEPENSVLVTLSPFIGSYWVADLTRSRLHRLIGKRYSDCYPDTTNG